jgi:uncharacterized protein with ParB-like and HNH nuclease domain
MDKLIYSVQQVFQDYREKGSYFNIPEYQRGYKWTGENAVQLLNDLKSFKKVNEEEFYCLQNITVTKSDDKSCINVIDGQQRLTTLFILLSYIQRGLQVKILNHDTNILKYSIRNSTDKFLHEQVVTGKLWDEDINPENAESKDMYYIMEVAKAIHDWYTNKDNFLDRLTILNDLKLIVNEVESDDEETVFASLNGGKVDLDGADLLRAILITRAAKQKYPTLITNEKIHQIANDDIDLYININLSSHGKINEYRVKLGVELDKMNLWWSDGDVQEFFVQLLPNRIAQNKSFKYSDYPIDLLYYAFFEANKDLFNLDKKDKDMVPKFFENGIDLNQKPGDDHLELYNAVKEFHLTMADWYNDKEIYNLIGYLMYNYKGNLISFELLWNVWKTARSKSDFKDKIKNIIRYQLAVASGGEIEEKLEDRKALLYHVIAGEECGDVEKKLVELRRCILNTTSCDWYHNDFTIYLLPLFDILPFTLTVNKKTKTDIRRVNAKYLKRTNLEDKEHVRSQTRNYDMDNLTEEDRNALDEENRQGINSLGNIVLLHQSVNRSYGNDKLILKMARICSEHILDDENSYIRPHTFDVFMSKMKNMESNGEADKDCFWTDVDIKRTVEDIDSKMAAYLYLPSIPENENKEELNNG